MRTARANARAMTHGGRCEPSARQTRPGSGISSMTKARRLTNACPADFRALVTGALLTGCRYGELAAMTVDDFNADSGTLRVRASKSAKPRHVVLTQEGSDFVAQQSAG